MFIVAMLIAASSALLYFYKDQVIAVFVTEANKYIKTPVSVDKIDMTIFDHFPNVAVVFDNVHIAEAVHQSRGTLATADKLYCFFNVFALIQGNYEIKEIVLENSTVNLRILQNGKNNFTFIEPNPERSGDQVDFDLQKIKLKEVLVNFTNEIDDQQFFIKANDLSASFNMLGNQVSVSLDGSVDSKFIRIEKNKYFEEKALGVKAVLHIDSSTGSFEIRPSKVEVHNAPFMLEGTYKNVDGRHLDMHISAENASFQSLISLLPENYRKDLSQYRSTGDVYFNCRLKGNINRSQLPAIKVLFGSSKASFYHPEYNQTIDDLDLEGSFSCSNLKSLRSARLELQQLNGSLDGGQFGGSLTLQNFEDFHLQAKINADLKIGSLLKMFPSKDITNIEGGLRLNVAFQGRINDFKSKHYHNRVKTSGDFTVKDLTFKLKGNNLDFNGFQGNFMFKNHDLAVNDFSGKIGQSGFLINGFFKNVIPFLLYKDQKLTIEADLKSDFIDFNELLFANKADEKTQGQGQPSEGEYEFKLSPNLDVNFNCSLNEVSYQRFNAKRVRGKVDLNDQVMKARNVKLHTMGGNLILNASFDAKNNRNIKVAFDSKLEKINIDSIFYVFKDFNQEFLTTRNLKGEIYSDVYASLILDQKLVMDPAKLIVDAGVIISKGELNDFEPMQSLSRFIKSQSLSRLKFPELKNNIHIENKVIHIPEMEVRNNVYSIFISGTHTFDQIIDYKLKIPLKGVFRLNRGNKDFEESVANDGKGGLNLFLTIKGTTDDYKITYDKKAVQDRIRSGLIKEKQEVKDAFKRKGPEQQEEKSLNEDEYFEF